MPSRLSRFARGVLTAALALVAVFALLSLPALRFGERVQVFRTYDGPFVERIAHAANLDFATQVKTNAAHAATTASPGFMTTTQVTKLNGLPASAATSSRLVNTTSPIQGGGDLTADRTLSLNSSALDSLVSGLGFVKSAAATNSIAVDCATVAALPAYTYSNGTAGVGATLTFSTGAPASIDGVTQAVNQSFLLHHGAAASNNGVYRWTSYTSGGAAVATRVAGIDTGATVLGSRVSVRQGMRMAGTEFTFRQRVTPTIGTTPLFYWRSNKVDPAYWYAFADDFLSNVGPTLNAPAGPGGLIFASNGGTGVFGAGSVNTAAVRGFYTGTTGALASAFIGFSDSWTAANTQPDGAGSLTISTNVGFRLELRSGVPVLSTGAQEFSRNIGLMKQRANSQTIAADMVGFVYYRPTNVNWMAVTSSAGTATGTTIDTGVAVVAGDFPRFTLEKFPGDDTVYLDLNGTNVLATSTNVPNATLLGMADIAFKTVGTTATQAWQSEYVSYDVQFPAGRVP